MHVQSFRVDGRKRFSYTSPRRIFLVNKHPDTYVLGLKATFSLPENAVYVDMEAKLISGYAWIRPL